MIEPVLLRSKFLYLFGLILLVSSISLSLYLTSLSQFILAGAFFIEGNFTEKLRRFLRNKAALIIAGIWLMHLIGLLYTSDIAEGLKDLRIKLPLLIFPVIMAGTEPLSKKQFNLVMAFFIGGIFTSSMISMAVLTGIIHHPVLDIRDIFIFHISHIRFALFTCIAIFALLHYLIFPKTSFSILEKMLLIVLAIWFVIFLFIMESVTGLSILILTFTLLLLFFAIKKKSLVMRAAFLLLAFSIPASVIFIVKKYVTEFYVNHDVTIDVNAVTSKGNHYVFDTTAAQLENGYPIWIYVCEDEMRTEWNKRSAFPYDSLDRRGQGVKYTLIRFLTSKGFRKDGDAISRLSEKEIHSIERGVANINYQDLTSMKSRLVQVLWEYNLYIRGGNPSGHSVTQRFEFWKAARGIISEHPIAGVGTGDMPGAYEQQYEKMHSQLLPKYRLRAHNQYLAITVAFGFLGLAYFIFALVAPMILQKKFRDYYYILFWITAVLSMITEDTLETQPGATFFGFFSCLFLFSKESDYEI
jgi:O-antigen ligase